MIRRSIIAVAAVIVVSAAAASTQTFAADTYPAAGQPTHASASLVLAQPQGVAVPRRAA